jgi:uncharacterized DUF497 family protein
MFCEWSAKKNEKLIVSRGICFEEIERALHETNNPVKVFRNSNYEDQFKMYVLIKSYIYVVPFRKTDNGIYLITAWRDRKINEKYKKGQL